MMGVLGGILFFFWEVSCSRRARACTYNMALTSNAKLPVKIDWAAFQTTGLWILALAALALAAYFGYVAFGSVAPALKPEGCDCESCNTNLFDEVCKDLGFEQPGCGNCDICPCNEDNHDCCAQCDDSSFCASCCSGGLIDDGDCSECLDCSCVVPNKPTGTENDGFCYTKMNPVTNAADDDYFLTWGKYSTPSSNLSYNPLCNEQRDNNTQCDASSTEQTAECTSMFCFNTKISNEHPSWELPVAKKVACAEMKDVFSSSCAASDDSDSKYIQKYCDGVSKTKVGALKRATKDGEEIGDMCDPTASDDCYEIKRPFCCQH